MCGIVGYIGTNDAISFVLQGLQRLEYRGYDSAGLAFVNDGVQVVKTVGKVAQLREKLGACDQNLTCAFGHTRWATHGGVTDANAHPHRSQDGRVVLVHNGIVENYERLREQLEKQGIHGVSDTDTEVVANLLSTLYKGDPIQALTELVKQLRGAYALVIGFADRPDELYCARLGSPLVVALGKKEAVCASDVPALAEFADQVFFMDEGELCRLTAGHVDFYESDGRRKDHPSRKINISADMIDRGEFEHFMIKEIHEQGSVVRKILQERVEGGQLHLENLLDLRSEQALSFDRFEMVACGSSCYAAMIAQSLLEQYLTLPVSVFMASEYRSRPCRLKGKALSLFVSQSGETSDTLAAIKVSKGRGDYCLAVTNQVLSSIARESCQAVDLRAGIEVGVAATKTVMAQVVTLLLIGLRLAQLRGDITKDDEKELGLAISSLPSKIEQTLSRYGQGEGIVSLCDRFASARDFLFLGRGSSFPVAMEGALKLKEISYVHAEAFAAGEMKHGPIALLDDQVPSVVVASDDSLLHKTLSNMQECLARRSPVILVTSDRVEQREDVAGQLAVPQAHPIISPMLMLIPMQLFAYYYAKRLGCEIDQPRNLAKSVTVE